MRAGEGRDHFGQGPEVEMDQAADGVVVEREIVVDAESPETGGTIEGFESRNQVPAAASIAPHGGPLWSQPTVVHQGSLDRDGPQGVAEKLGVKRQDPDPLDAAIRQNHRTAQVRGASPFGIDPISSADMNAQ